MTTIKVRRDTAANWSSANPILAEGEMGLDTTNDFVKMGDGATAWNSLAYMNAPVFQGHTALWIRAADMLTAGGSPSISVEGGGGNSQVPIWRLDGATAEAVCGSTILPGSGWATVNIKGVFCSIASGSGDVLLRCVTEELIDGVRIGDNDTTHADVTLSVNAANSGVVEIVTLKSGLSVTAGRPLGVTVERRADQPGDTLNALDYCLIGVAIERAS